MAKLLDGGIAYSGRIIHPIRIFSERLKDRLGDRIIRIREVFQQISSSEEAIFTDQSENPQKFEEIRNRAFLDIHRNVR